MIFMRAYSFNFLMLIHIFVFMLMLPILYLGIKACMEVTDLVEEEPYEINLDSEGCHGGPKAGRLGALSNVNILSLVLCSCKSRAIIFTSIKISIILINVLNCSCNYGMVFDFVIFFGNVTFAVANLQCGYKDHTNLDVVAISVAECNLKPGS